MIRRNFFSAARNDVAVQRRTISPLRHLVTRPVGFCIVPNGLSMMFVVARQRTSEDDTPKAFMVKRSSIPSRRLAAAPGYSFSSHRAWVSIFTRPALASRRNAALITETTWSQSSSGSCARTLRTLWSRQRCTAWCSPKTRRIPLRSAFDPSITNK